ncbi:sensor histidine kinase [Clostridium felsineum]|uniref:sensor histidine kinase n=1 Tax=Clostridium felsineum TaxID=36839 RepID=UPI00098C35BB|nr:HAMP domain-containing sensor histidine kinase [Clostridium felsineum]URZ14239.1 Adaptive-response sensory-kinase SasA [Clostridium felsineum DSM 794]
MKIFKIKTITMRIWITFTIMILIIVCSISLLYISAFRAFDESQKMQDLKTAHDTIIKNPSTDKPLRFDKIKNLERSKSFLVTVKSDEYEIQDVNKSPNGGPMMPDNNMRKWIIGYLDKAGNSEKQFKDYYNGMKVLFIISPASSYGKDSYFVTYMPYFVDNRILYQVCLVGLVFIIIGFFTAKIVAGHISKPLKELENYTKRIANKEWKEPIEVSSDDEIGSLANSMNIMQKQLKYADENEKMFLQSISHDLKTPVMVIMSHAEAIIDGIYIDSVEKTAEIIKDEAIRLEKKIKQMLYLNTLDYILENDVENKIINLNNLLYNMVDRFEIFNFDIKTDISEDAINFLGNEEKIKIAIENILDNALRYARKEIVLRLKRYKENLAEIEIYNDGENISEKSIEKIFDNLYKDKKGKFGLGLAISKKIVDFYGGEIKAINRKVGVSFLIKCPIYKGEA